MGWGAILIFFKPVIAMKSHESSGDDDAPEEITQKQAREISDDVVTETKKLQSKTKRGIRSERKRIEKSDKLPESILKTVAKLKQQQEEEQLIPEDLKKPIVIGGLPKTEPLNINTHGIQLVVNGEYSKHEITEEEYDSDESEVENIDQNVQTFTERFLQGKRHNRAPMVQTKKSQKTYHRF